MTVLDWCRHCTNEDVMTLEHLPPKSAGNDQPINVVDDAGTIIRQFSEGHAVPALRRTLPIGRLRNELDRVSISGEVGSDIQFEGRALEQGVVALEAEKALIKTCRTGLVK